jgi:hypothetical protein
MTVALATVATAACIVIDMRDAALDDLRDQLEGARADRDRAQARCRELELRLDAIREVVR